MYIYTYIRAVLVFDLIFILVIVITKKITFSLDFR